MAEAVYILSGVMSLVCTVLLIRGYRSTGTRLLLWTSLCFVGLTLNNILVFIDLVAKPNMDLSISRSVTGIIGVAFLLYGVLWDRPQ